MDLVDPETIRKHGAVTRRSFLRQGAVAAGGLAGAPYPASQAARRSSLLDLLRAPDAVTVYGSFAETLPAAPVALVRTADLWHGGAVTVATQRSADALLLTLHSPGTAVAAVHLRWHAAVEPGLLVLGDAWERSYGELGWRTLIPERVLPWYLATYDGTLCHGYGVRTDAGALCFWQVDGEGASLWLNVANGGSGVELGTRQLRMASVVARPGVAGENASEAVTALCRMLCARPSRPAAPIYGANDWCYSYGRSTAESILRDTGFLVGVSPAGTPRPFSVIDGGWSDGTPAWPDMGRLASRIREQSARPGLWIRPLEAEEGTPARLLLPDARFGDRKDRARARAYDPTVPEARARIAAKVREAAAWGYEMIKHDFSTYDLLGQWGFEMGPQPTLPGWSLADRGLTNAEVIASLYALLREAAGEQVLLDGCNTVGHLGQGIFDLQRSGDDTSGRHWERTRRMGVNTLAFRLPQHGTFFTLDPDLVGITDAVPWSFNRQWLDALARSGAVTMVSAAPSQRGPEQTAALRAAFAIAAAGGQGARPLDWMETSAPARWRGAEGSAQQYDWNGPGGASPFLSP